MVLLIDFFLYCIRNIIFVMSKFVFSSNDISKGNENSIYRELTHWTLYPEPSIKLIDKNLLIKKIKEDKRESLKNSMRNIVSNILNSLLTKNSKNKYAKNMCYNIIFANDDPTFFLALHTLMNLRIFSFKLLQLLDVKYNPYIVKGDRRILLEKYIKEYNDLIDD